MALPYVPPLQNKFVTVTIDDISTAGQEYFVPGFNGRIRKAHSVINGAIGTADADLTLKIGGTAVTGGVITVATASSAAGDVDTCSPTAARSFTSTDSIEVETDGASTNTVAVTVTLELEPA